MQAATGNVAKLEMTGLGLGRGHHAVSFLLGAALPTFLLFLLASDRVGEHLSNWGINGLGGDGAAAPAHEHVTNEKYHRYLGCITQPMENSIVTSTLEPFPGLAELLAKVAMEDGTVIVTSVNEAWARPGSLFELFRDGFKNGEGIEHLLAHVLAVAVDPAGFDLCAAVHPHCYLLDMKSMNLSSAKRFMSKDYLEIVWTKLSLQQRVLELGYSFLFTDCDITWFRDPFRRIPVYADMTTSSDDFSPARAPLDNPLNTGFYYMKATNRSVEVLRYWRAARARFPGAHDQAVFGRIKHELVAKLGARIEPLDTVYFGGFCEYHDDVDKTVTMHADCCIGLDTKVHDLKDIAADWKNYTSLTPEERKKKTGGFRWTVPAMCRSTIRWRKPVHP